MDSVTQAKVTVELGERTYSIEIGDRALETLASVCGATAPGRIVVVADESVHLLHGKELARSTPGSSLRFTIPSGEASKSLETATRAYDWLASHRIGRDDLIIAFGGGVAGDLAGFIAGTWMRGIPYVQVPTTLLAAIDASVGGKTAVNTSAAKNLVGVFHQPRGVFVNLGFLRTLPERDLIAALAESVKHAAISNPEFLEWQISCARTILTRDPGVLCRLIAHNCAIKAHVVARDERERGLRAILNYGHTIGHALEHLLEFELRHGECVGLGVLVENQIARARGLLPDVDARTVARALDVLGLPSRLPRPVDARSVFALCQLDKKSQDGNVHMVVLQGLGKPVRILDVTAGEVGAALGVIAPQPR